MIDKQALTEQIARVIKYSQDYPFDVNAAPLIDQWYEAKKRYIQLFNGKLILKSSDKISVVLTDEEQQRKFDNFIDLCEDKGWFDTCAGFYDFLQRNRAGFFENKVIVDDPSMKIAKGMKLLKCFKKYFTDMWELRQAQDIASQVIQEKKVEGYLFLSVHPMDYLTISENNNNWRSCHSLDGEFRAGNLNYMVDESTVIAYIASDEEERLQCMPEDMTWNNKKWRMLIHTDCFLSVIYFNRQYPFSSDSLLEITYNYLSETFEHIRKRSFRDPIQIGFNTVLLGKNQDETYPLDHSFLTIYNNCIDAKDVFDYSQYNGYQDLVYSEHYLPIAAWSVENGSYRWYATREEQKQEFHKNFDITIGRRCHCVKCGKGIMENSDSFLCDSCIVDEDGDEDYFLVCGCCGSRIYPEDKAHQDEHGIFYCDTCWGNMKKEKE